MCFLVDCTGSMASHIEAVKNNIQDLRDRLVREYTGSDLIFAFVGYTDYDQAASTRTSVLQYTRLVRSITLLHYTGNTSPAL